MANAIFLPVSGVVPVCEGLISRPSEKSRMRCLNKRGRESWDWAEQKSLYKKNFPHKVGEEALTEIEPLIMKILPVAFGPE